MNTSVKVGKQSLNMFRRRKGPRPQDSSPAGISEIVRDNDSASIANAICGSAPRSSKAATVQANPEKTELTHDSGNRVASKELALPRDQDDRTPESDDLEIRLISDTIPIFDHGREQPIHDNSSTDTTKDGNRLAICSMDCQLHSIRLQSPASKHFLNTKEIGKSAHSNGFAKGDFPASPSCICTAFDA
jgi:hypothetical protein